jgi:exopolyphosphatase/guanosine-5'-triphosphate,3'-diphosphate pyrophosphatase
MAAKKGFRRRPGHSQARAAGQEEQGQSSVTAYVNGPRRAPWGRQDASRTGHESGPADTLYAALDLGTNNCRLLVARPDQDGFRVVDAFSRIVRLGEGLAASGELSAPAMARTIEALKICAGKIRRRGVTRMRAVATEACRRAANCEEFLAAVKRATGIELEIISQNEEAALAICGCAPLIDPDIPDILLFDIGGGSTEICWLKVEPQPGGSQAALAMHGWLSVPIGVITLAERYGGGEISGEAYQAMEDDMAAAVAGFDRRFGVSRSVSREGVQMLGTSGTVTTLAGVHKDLPRYDRARVDGSYLDMTTVREVCRRITAMSYDDRAAHPCIGPERADLVVAGCAILAALCRIWPAERLRVADRGLREGMLYAMIHGVRAPQGRWAAENEPPESEAEILATPGVSVVTAPLAGPWPAK